MVNKILQNNINRHFLYEIFVFPFFLKNLIISMLELRFSWLFFKGMALFMSSKIWTLRESLITTCKLTSIRFLSCVRAKMSLQIKIKGEGFPTNLTAIRTFTSMHKLMSSQFRIIHKSFPASLDLANVLFVSMR